MDEEKHWNTIGSSYNSEIFDVFRLNKDQKLQRYFKKYRNKNHHATDFGCGTGKAFPFIAPYFKEVFATDISENLLDIAKSLRYKNIHFKRADLTRTDVSFPKTDFAFCCNVAILPRREGNLSIFRNIERSIRKGGHALLVIPSLESVLYSTSRMVEWYGKEDVQPIDIPRQDLAYYKNAYDIAQGIIYIDDVPTKHYLETELKAIFHNSRLRVLTIDKLEYDWRTEFETPPRWLKDPYPWDWLVECVKE